MGNRTIVMLPDVEAAIEVMGKPEDFGGEPVEKPGADKAGKRPFRAGKKLYRDEEDAVIGGVCSGLAAYFGMQEPIWMRPDLRAAGPDLVRLLGSRLYSSMDSGTPGPHCRRSPRYAGRNGQCGKHRPRDRAGIRARFPESQ
jgi:hypothetical protein